MTNQPNQMTETELAARRARRAIVRDARRAMDETRESERRYDDAMAFAIVRDRDGYGHAVRVR